MSGPLVTLSLLVWLSAASAQEWRAELVADVAYGSADTLFGFDNIEEGPHEGGGLLIVPCYSVSACGLFIADGVKRDIKVFDHNGGFVKRILPTWPKGVSVRTKSIPLDDIQVCGDSVFVLAGFIGRPADPERRREFTRYQIFVYSVESGLPLGRYRFLNEDLVNKYGGYARPYRLVLEDHVAYIYCAEEMTVYPVAQNGRELSAEEQTMGLPGLPLQRGRVRFNRADQRIELLDTSGRIVHRLAGGLPSVSPSGSMFITRSSGLTIYDARGQKLGEISREVVTKNAHPTPFRLTFETFKVGPGDRVYGCFPTERSVRVVRWLASD